MSLQTECASFPDWCAMHSRSAADDSMHDTMIAESLAAAAHHRYVRLQEFAAQADALSGFVLGELTRCSEMTRGKGSTGLALHELLHTHISCTLHLQLAAVKVGLCWLQCLHDQAGMSCCGLQSVLSAKLRLP